MKKTCPNCGSANHTEQELARKNGVLDVFAVDSPFWVCSKYGTQGDRGCGFKFKGER